MFSRQKFKLLSKNFIDSHFPLNDFCAQKLPQKAEGNGFARVKANIREVTTAMGYVEKTLV